MEIKKISNYNLDFMKEDIETGLLKNKNVGMVRQTLKFINGQNIKEFIYLPQFKDFTILRIKSRFEK